MVVINAKKNHKKKCTHGVPLFEHRSREPDVIKLFRLAHQQVSAILSGGNRRLYFSKCFEGRFIIFGKNLIVGATNRKLIFGVFQASELVSG